MHRVTFALMRRELRMLALAGIAIVISTAFISATFLFGGALGDMLTQTVSVQYGSATHVVSNNAFDKEKSKKITVQDTQEIAHINGVSVARMRMDGWWRAIISKDARSASSFAEPMAVANQAVSQKQRDSIMPLQLTSGTWPSSSTQIALNETTARTLKAHVGDQVSVQVLDTSEEDTSGDTHKGQRVTCTISGIVSDPNNVYAQMNGASVLPPALFPHESVTGRVAGFYLILNPSVPSASAAVSKQLGYGWNIQPRAKAIHRQVMNMSGGQDAVQIFLMIFGILALLVAGLVIANTFQVIVAHRRRILALLRAIGAQKSQLYGSVVQEASVLGLVASAIGVGLACLVMWIVTLLPSGVIYLGSGVSLHFVPVAPAFIVPIVFGVIVTILASLSAAHSATSVTPLEALRPMAQTPTRKAGAVRAIISVLLLISGAVLTVLSYVKMTQTSNISSDVFQTYLLVGILACALLFIGLTVSAVWWMPWCMHGSSWLVSKIGPASHIAGANIMRNPRRVAATGTALLIGVTLVTTIGTGASTMNATAEKKLDAHYSVDISVNATGNVTSKDLAAVKRVDGISDAVLLHRIKATITRNDQEASSSSTSGKSSTSKKMTTDEIQDASEPWDTSIYVISNADRDRVMRGASVTASPHTLLVAQNEYLKAAGVKNNQPVTIRLGATAKNGEKFTTVASVRRFTVPTDAMIVILATPDQLPAAWREAAASHQHAQKTILWARANPSVDGIKLMNKLQSALSDSGETQILGPLAERQQFEKSINQILIVLVALLAVSVLIALIGVANTLSLSVIERTRESATLRAIGMTKAQLRRSLAVEALILSVTASIAGLIVGSFFGWFGSVIILTETFGVAVFSFNWAIAGAILLISIITALISSVAPARRAVRTSPVEVLSEA